MVESGDLLLNRIQALVDLGACPLHPGKEVVELAQQFVLPFRWCRHETHRRCIRQIAQEAKSAWTITSVARQGPPWAPAAPSTRVACERQ